MDWQNERYVRSYTRDTVTRRVWTWQARAIWDALLRKMDRAGVMDIGENDLSEAVSAMVDIPPDVVAEHLPSILKSKAIVVIEECLVMPNFVEAQEANQSDKQRQAESRARRRAKAMREEVLSDVTKCDEVSHAVTDSHAESHDVTPSLAKPSLAVPSQEKSVTRKRATKPLPPEAIEIAQYLYEAIRSHSPGFMADAQPSVIERKLTSWARDVDRGLRLDGMTPQGCRDAIDAAHRSADGFWRDNLLSGAKLRKHYEKLRIKGAKPQTAQKQEGLSDDVRNFDFVGAGQRMDEFLKRARE